MSKFDKLAITIILLTSCVVFILSSKSLLTTDAQRYEILARNVISGRGYNLGGDAELVFPPGYPILLIPFILIGINPQLSVSLLMGSAYFFIGYFTYHLLKKLNISSPLIAALLILINGNLLFFAVLGYAEILWLALFLGFFYTFLDHKEIPYLSGFFAGLAYLVKPEALLYVFIVCVIYYFPKKKINKKLLIRVFLPILIFISIYSSYLYIKTDRVMLSGKSIMFYWDQHIENKNVTRDQLFYKLNGNFQTLPDYGKSIGDVDIIKRIKLNTNGFKISLFEILLPLKLVILNFFLIFLMLREERKHLFKMLCIFSTSVLTLLFHIENRYLVVILYGVVGFLSYIFLKYLNDKDNIKRIIAFYSIVTILMITYYSYYPIRKEYPNLVNEKIKVENFIRTQDLEGRLIISRKPVYSFYTKGDYHVIPYEPDEKIMEKFFERYENEVLILDDWSKNGMPDIHNMLLNNMDSFGVSKILVN